MNAVHANEAFIILAYRYETQLTITGLIMAKPGFRFTHYDLRELRAGAIIEVSLNAVNNVRLMTSGNYQRFTEMLDFKYLGGVAKKSPIRVTIPETSHWHLIVDCEGHNTLAESAVKMLPPRAVPLNREASQASA